MTAIDYDPRLVQPLDELDSKTAQACIGPLFTSVPNVVLDVVGQLNNADAERFVEVDQVKVILDGLRALKVQIKPQVSALFGLLNVLALSHEEQVIALTQQAM